MELIPDKEVKIGGPPPDRHHKLDRDSRAVNQRPRRFGRRMARAAYTGRRLHRVTPEALASGEVEARLARRAAGPQASKPARYLDLVDYIVSRGWTTKRSQARAWLRSGKVNINGATWAYPSYPVKDLEHDSAGRPRIMVEGQPDPRRVS